MADNATINNLGSMLTRAEYLLFRDLVESNSGIDLEDRDWTPLRAALCERVSAIGYPSFGEYYELLKSPDGFGELNRLIELLTVHETSFFRNQVHFDLLENVIIPELRAKNASTRTIRIWSAGCSTGQEAYSIAITLLESLRAHSNWQAEVLATDISQRALDVARAGVYEARAVRGVKPGLLDRYFEPWERGYRVKDEVRRIVRFEHLNLVKEPFPLSALCHFDIVFCENVTIYFKIDSTRRVIRNFYDVLHEGGYLFLGYSESLWQISNDFVLRDLGRGLVYQKPSRAEVDEQQSTSTKAVLVEHEQPQLKKISDLLQQRSKRDGQPARSTKKSIALADAEALYEARRFEEALLAVEAILDISPADLKAHLLAAKLRADREEIGPALRHCRKIIEHDPLNEETHYLAGVMLLRSGEKLEAIKSLSKVIYLNPSGCRAAIAHFHLGGLYADLNNRDASLRAYKNALRLLERLPKDKLVEEFSAGFLAKVCRRRLEELTQSG